MNMPVVSVVIEALGTYPKSYCKILEVMEIKKSVGITKTTSLKGTVRLLRIGLEYSSM